MYVITVFKAPLVRSTVPNRWKCARPHDKKIYRFWGRQVQRWECRGTTRRKRTPRRGTTWDKQYWDWDQCCHCVKDNIPRKPKEWQHRLRHSSSIRDTKEVLSIRVTKWSVGGHWTMTSTRHFRARMGVYVNSATSWLYDRDYSTSAAISRLCGTTRR